MDYNQIIAGRSNLTTCAYSLPYLTSRWAQQCCYTDRAGVGRVLTTGQPESGSPFLVGIQGLPIITDLEAQAYCCNSSLCALYYQRRPSDTCSGYNSRRRGKAVVASFGTFTLFKAACDDGLRAYSELSKVAQYNFLRAIPNQLHLAERTLDLTKKFAQFPSA